MIEEVLREGVASDAWPGGSRVRQRRDHRGGRERHDPVRERTAARLFGRTSDELLGAPLVSLMPERLRERHLHAFANFVATGESRLVGRAPVELVALTAGGEEVPIELSLGSWAADGERRVTGVLRDISARKAAERAARAQEAVSRVLAETDDVDKAMKALLRELGTVMGWRVGLFWVRSGAGLTLRSSWHASEGGRAFLERSASMVFARGIGLPGRAWHEGRPVWVEDFREVASFPRAPDAGRDDLRAAIALPVIDSQHEVIGVIEFLGHSEGARRPTRWRRWACWATGSASSSDARRRRRSSPAPTPS